MTTLYLCWQNDNTVLGIATSEKKAKELCSEFGDSYMKVESNKSNRNCIETTKLCIYHVHKGFKTFDECIKAGYTFKTRMANV